MIELGESVEYCNHNSSLLKSASSLFVFFLLTAMAWAQDPYYMAISKADGLPTDVVYDIYQDKQGFVWITGEDGLARYDGQQFKLYTSISQTSKSGSYIQEDNLGRIWYENFDGYLYHTSGDTLLSVQQKVPYGFTEYGLSNNSVFLRSLDGIRIFELGAEDHYRDLSLKQELCYGASVFNNQFQLFGTQRVVVSEQGQYSIDDYPLIFHNDRKTFGVRGDGGYYFIQKLNTENQLVFLSDDKTIKRLPFDAVEYIQNVFYIDHKLWLCCTDGLYVLDSEGHLINNRPYFKGKNIACLMKDREGNLWVGTVDEGILLVSDFAQFYTPLENIMPYRIIAEPNGLKIASKKSGIYQFQNDGAISLLHNTANHHSVDFFDFDSLSNTYIYTDVHFNAISRSYKEVLFNTTCIKDAIRISEKYYWCAASSCGGLLKIGDSTLQDKWDALYNSSVLYTENSFGILLKTRGKNVAADLIHSKLYITTNIGLFQATVDTLIERLQPNGDHWHLSQLCMFQDKLIGLSTRGRIFCFDENGTEKEIIFPANSNLKVRIYGMKPVDNHLIFYSDSRLFFLDDITKPQIREIYGLHKEERINDVAMYGKTLYIATNKGIVQRSLISQKPEAQPYLYITDIRTSIGKRELTDLIELSYNERDVEIDFALLAFNPSVVYDVAYSINSDVWKDLTSNSRSLQLAELAPGNYDIKFRINGTDIIKSVRFQIIAPWWKELWFIITCASFILLLGYFYLKYQTGLLRKRNRLLEEKIILEKSVHSATMKSIKSQMNPHFFYNALNTIQSFIFSDDKRNATTYLSKFSNLTRKILEMSEKENVTLKEEIEALQLYLDIEKVRFNKDFNFHFSIPSNIQTEAIQFPSMLIQPFVENAIRHGLLHKQGEKLLVMAFEISEKTLRISIDDNGIGRKKAGELNTIKQKNHHSFSTEANLKRIEILQKSNPIWSFKYIDKSDNNGQSAGTRVEITLPI